MEEKKESKQPKQPKQTINKQLEELNEKLAKEIQTEVNTDNLALGGENLVYANEND